VKSEVRSQESEKILKTGNKTGNQGIQKTTPEERNINSIKIPYFLFLAPAKRHIKMQQSEIKNRGTVVTKDNPPKKE